MSDLVWLDKIEQRVEAATPGPWATLDGTEVHPIYGSAAFAALCRIVGPWDNSAWYDRRRAEANATFIAAARSDVPKLCRAVRELIQALESVLSILPAADVSEGLYEDEAAVLARWKRGREEDGTSA